MCNAYIPQNGTDRFRHKREKQRYNVCERFVSKIEIKRALEERE